MKDSSLQLFASVAQLSRVLSQRQSHQCSSTPVHDRSRPVSLNCLTQGTPSSPSASHPAVPASTLSRRCPSRRQGPSSSASPPHRCHPLRRRRPLYLRRPLPIWRQFVICAGPAGGLVCRGGGRRASAVLPGPGGGNRQEGGSSARRAVPACSTKLPTGSRGWGWGGSGEGRVPHLGPFPPRARSAHTMWLLSPPPFSRPIAWTTGGGVGGHRHRRPRPPAAALAATSAAGVGHPPPSLSGRTPPISRPPATAVCPLCCKSPPPFPG